MRAIDTAAKAEQARSLFLKGCNCAQAVFAAYADEMGLSEKEALRIAGGMGGGIGGLRFTCGAVSAMALVLGALQGYDDPADAEGKKQLYARIQTLHARFTDEYQTSNCKALLEAAGIAANAMPSERTPEYYKTRPCVRYVEKCAELVGEELNHL